ncbi:hypothetical protein LJ753_01780 [Arthrobacter sp. zg-Y20]|uniref:hypothetical protein n=1 Tax=unclassified Arthrobacter TaxID=235627 RepID=UPI001D14AD1A|nr:MULTISPECIES: hypothetical protein [unclassified Arthrobacter]MCC3274600.1 hypothetical protein [Arthrobacter sp. zg-Y20]MDK1314757.1 hypothetical protein [Arthrobacter sp. zg.Y20]WIB04622.1 hypothetical protein QNO06_08530 [Arthrobacter sp. zg-Y20]
MTILINRPAAATTTRETSYRAAPAAASSRPLGSYTTRYDRPQAAARPEGSYVSAASQATRVRGSYTRMEGAAQCNRPVGTYTLRG